MWNLGWGIIGKKETCHKVERPDGCCSDVPFLIIKHVFYDRAIKKHKSYSFLAQQSLSWIKVWSLTTLVPLISHSLSLLCYLVLFLVLPLSDEGKPVYTRRQRVASLWSSSLICIFCFISFFILVFFLLKFNTHRLYSENWIFVKRINMPQASLIR